MAKSGDLWMYSTNNGFLCVACNLISYFPNILLCIFLGRAKTFIQAETYRTIVECVWQHMLEAKLALFGSGTGQYYCRHHFVLLYNWRNSSSKLMTRVPLSFDSWWRTLFSMVDKKAASLSIWVLKSPSTTLTSPLAWRSPIKHRTSSGRFWQPHIGRSVHAYQEIVEYASPDSQDTQALIDTQALMNRWDWYRKLSGATG